MSLTKMKRAFIAAYCQNPKLGQAEAARSAGCSVKRAKVTAYEWMRDPEVKREIDRQIAHKVDRIDVRANTGELTAETVIRELNDIAEMCRTAGAGAWQTAGLLKVAELKGKYLKMWTERVEFGLDEKLIALLEAGRKRAAGIAEAPNAPPLAPPGPPVLKGEILEGQSLVPSKKRSLTACPTRRTRRKKKRRACLST
jgi:Terminase small subunit